MNETTRRSHKSILHTVSVGAALALMSLPSSAELIIDVSDVPNGPWVGEGFLTLPELPALGEMEERVTDYEAALRWRSRTGATEAHDSPEVPDFVDIVVDLSSQADPDDALAAAGELAPVERTAELYEELGEALLIAARQARLGGEGERAEGHLRAARHVFALADRRLALDGVTGPGDQGLLHRALVGMEETLATDSRDSWPHTADLLTRLGATGDKPVSEWSRRMVQAPETFVGEQDDPSVWPQWIDGNALPPKPIFVPRPRRTPGLSRACVSGIVIVQTVIDRHGTVAGLKLLKGLPTGLSEETLRTVATWLFEPAKMDGEPVVAFHNLVVRFENGAPLDPP